MVTIQLDDETAAALRLQAARAGTDLEEYLRLLAGRGGAASNPDWNALERELEVLSGPGPGLPADFSRADIYADHD